MKRDFIEEIEIPDKTGVRLNKGIVTVNGQKGEIKKNLLNKRILIEIRDNKVIISSKKATQREKKILYTIKAHIENMIYGVNNGYTYVLKVCSSHFPMSVTIDKGKFAVKNFLGESQPRIFKIVEGVEVKLEGERVSVSSPDKELAGQTAASIEQLCRIANRDRRVFQDGIYITSKSRRVKNE